MIKICKSTNTINNVGGKKLVPSWCNGNYSQLVIALCVELINVLERHANSVCVCVSPLDTQTFHVSLKWLFTQFENWHAAMSSHIAWKPGAEHSGIQLVTYFIEFRKAYKCYWFVEFHINQLMFWFCLFVEICIHRSCSMYMYVFTVYTIHSTCYQPLQKWVVGSSSSSSIR